MTTHEKNTMAAGLLEAVALGGEASSGAGEPEALEWVTAHWSREELGDPAGILAVASILRLRELIIQSLEETVASLGLTSTDYLVLLTVMLGDEGRRPLGRIARAMMVHPTTVTQAVDRLEAEKLVRRVPHPSDRRAKLATLTKRGRSVCQAATEAWRSNGFGMPGVSDVELGELVAVIAPLRAAAGDQPRRLSDS